MIGVWVKVLQVPYRYMFPCALFFIAIGVYSTNNSLFEVNEVLVFGIVGATISITNPRRLSSAVVAGANSC